MPQDVDGLGAGVDGVDARPDEALESAHRVRGGPDLVDRPVGDAQHRGVGLGGGVHDLLGLSTRRGLVRRVEVAQAGGVGDQGEDPLLGAAAHDDRVQEPAAGLDVDHPDAVPRVRQRLDGGGRAHLLTHLVVAGLDALDGRAGRGAGEGPGTGDRADLVEAVPHDAQGVARLDVQESVAAALSLVVGSGGDLGVEIAVDHEAEGEDHPDHGRQEEEPGGAARA